MRRLLTFLVVASATAGATTWWLYEGDLAEAVAPVVPEWDAKGLALQQGMVDPGLPLAGPSGEEPTDVPEE